MKAPPRLSKNRAAERWLRRIECPILGSRFRWARGSSTMTARHASVQLLGAIAAVALFAATAAPAAAQTIANPEKKKVATTASQAGGETEGRAGQALRRRPRPITGRSTPTSANTRATRRPSGLSRAACRFGCARLVRLHLRRRPQGTLADGSTRLEWSATTRKRSPTSACRCRSRRTTRTSRCIPLLPRNTELVSKPLAPASRWSPAARAASAMPRDRARPRGRACGGDGAHARRSGRARRRHQGCRRHRHAGAAGDARL